LRLLPSNIAQPYYTLFLRQFQEISRKKWV